MMNVDEADGAVTKRTGLQGYKEWAQSTHNCE